MCLSASDALRPLVNQPPLLNGYQLAFDPALLGEIQLSYRQQILPYFQTRPQILAGGKVLRRRLSHYDLFSYDDYPLLWLSANQHSSFGIYQRFFENLKLAELFGQQLDCRARPQLYCGFLVIGNQASQPLWHQDYQPGAPAYTLLSPLFDWWPEHGHLYYRHGEQQQVYSYQRGEALLVGAGLEHSTQPYALSSQLRVLVSLTFGSDRLSDWPLIKANIQSQSRYYYLPCGHLRGKCLCLQKQAWRTLLQR